MNATFKKLNYKDHPSIIVLQAPPSFQATIDEMRATTAVKGRIAPGKEIDFLMAFVTKQKEVEDITHTVAPLLKSDGILWFAYPKGTSKNYVCEFNRDTGWEALGQHGFEPVRMVAIDADWSALRFRRAEHIKKMTRSVAMSETGKRKVAATKTSMKTK
jgi:hypothetical protein